VNPQDVVVDSTGDMFVTDGNNHRVQKFDKSGNYLLQFGSNGGSSGQFNYPEGIAIDRANMSMLPIREIAVLRSSIITELPGQLEASEPATGNSIIPVASHWTVRQYHRRDWNNSRIGVRQQRELPRSVWK